MKKYLLSLLVMLVFSSVTSLFAGEYERTYEQWYAVNAEADLTIDNQYGEIVINTWDKSEVKIIVTIYCEASKQEKADKFFDNIEIHFDGNKSAVSAETSLHFRRSRVKNFSIDYSVFAPASMTYKMRNKFGDIFLPDLGGPVSMVLKYGEFTIGRLLNDDNFLDINYSEGEILSIEGGTLEIDYSEVEIENIGQVRFDSDFSDVSVQKAEIIDVETSYDELDFGEIDMLTIESKFSDIDVDALNVGLKGNFNYGKFALERTKVSVEEIFISGKFTEMHIGLNSEIAWKFLANTEYGELEFSDPVDYIDESEENYYKKLYSGVLWGKSSPSASFSLEAKNSDIEIVKF